MKMVLLCECSRQKCRHIYLGTEMRYVDDGAGTKRGECPKCGEESYFPLDEAGQRRKGSAGFVQHEISAAIINPSPRMGLKRRRRILAAKSRAQPSLAPISLNNRTEN